MSKRHRIAATLTTLAAATTLSLAAAGTASAQDDSDFPDAHTANEFVEENFGDAAEEAQADIMEESADLYAIYLVDWNADEEAQADHEEAVNAPVFVPYLSQAPELQLGMPDPAMP